MSDGALRGAKERSLSPASLDFRGPTGALQGLVGHQAARQEKWQWKNVGESGCVPAALLGLPHHDNVAPGWAHPKAPQFWRGTAQHL